MKYTLKLLLSMIFFTACIYLVMGAQAQGKTKSITLHSDRGTSQTYSGKEMAGVFRKNLGKYKKLYYDLLRKRGKSSPSYNIKRVTKTTTIRVYRANIAFLHLGFGKNGVTVKDQNGALIVEEKKVPVLGLTYARHLSSGFYAGLSGYTNELVTGQVGYSW